MRDGKKQNILVVGGAGYVGSHVCKALARYGYEPICLDDFSTGHREFVRWGDLVEVDLCQEASLTEKLAGLEFCAVIHLAAGIEVRDSIRDPLRFFHNNVGGTISLLRALLAHHGRVPILFSSTAAVYGDTSLDRIPETSPLKPVNPYGTGKRMVEDMLRDLWEHQRWPSLILRYFNVAGADPESEIGEWHVPETHLIPRLLAAIDDRSIEVKIYGDSHRTPDGTCVRDYVHVSNLAEAHVCALDYLLHTPLHDCFNVGYGQGHSVREVLAAVERVGGREVPHHLVAKRPGEAGHLVADASRVRRRLDWQPRYAERFDDIIAHAWAWHRKLSSLKLSDAR